MVAGARIRTGEALLAPGYEPGYFDRLFTPRH